MYEWYCVGVYLSLWLAPGVITKFEGPLSYDDLDDFMAVLAAAAFWPLSIVVAFIVMNNNYRNALAREEHYREEMKAMRAQADRRQTESGSTTMPPGVDGT